MIALHAEDLARLGLAPGADPLAIKPNDVPGRPQPERAFVEDPATPAPGADAFRWFFYASSPPWTNTRHSLTNVRSTQKEFLVKLRNVYSFFVIYANIDGFSPADGNPDAKGTSPADLAKSTGYRAAKDRGLLDRWILSELALATREVTAGLETYHLYEAAQRLDDLVDALSNWYVRRSRARFWAAVTMGAPERVPQAPPGHDRSSLLSRLGTSARASARALPRFALVWAAAVGTMEVSGGS